MLQQLKLIPNLQGLRSSRAVIFSILNYLPFPYRQQTFIRTHTSSCRCCLLLLLLAAAVAVKESLTWAVSPFYAVVRVCPSLAAAAQCYGVSLLVQWYGTVRERKWTTCLLSSLLWTLAPSPYPPLYLYLYAASLDTHPDSGLDYYPR